MEKEKYLLTYRQTYLDGLEHGAKYRGCWLAGPRDRYYSPEHIPDF